MWNFSFFKIFKVFKVLKFNKYWQKFARETVFGRQVKAPSGLSTKNQEI